jgi:putative addiction module killer protein
MEAYPRELIIYQTEQGEVPFLEWLDSLRDRASRARIRKRLDSRSERLRQRVELGNFGDYKAVGEGVYELRIDCGPGYRVYYGKVDMTIVLLLCGGDKNTQTEDIAQAKQFWNDFNQC